MHEKAIIFTNNILAFDSLNAKYKVIMVEGNLMMVLTTVRDYIHKGHILLTHPLMGSIKPNETPYKTVVVTFRQVEGVDYESLMYIEKSIETTNKMLLNKPMRNWEESVLEDFRVIDFDLIFNVIDS